MNDWESQVEPLSERQRLLLARWLGIQKTPNATHTNERQRIVAYVTASSPTATPSPNEIRDILEARLPEYMLPEHIVVLDEWPRLPNGKVDVRKLPHPQQPTLALSQDVKPANEVETILLKIWSELLHTEMLSVHDNFFEFGGDSIISIQVISRAREAGLQIEPRQLAERPTIAELAQVVTRQLPKQMRVGATNGEARLLPIQQWFLNRDLESPSHWNQSRVFAVDPRVSPDNLQIAVRCCMEHHDALRTQFIHNNGEWKQSIPSASAAVVELERIDNFDAVKRCQADLSLSDGPLIRFLLIKSPAHTSASLVIVAHHLVVDQLSWAILAEDLNLACQQIVDGEQPALSPKTTSILEWSNQLTEFAQSRDCEDTLNYWQQNFTKDAERLPVDLTEAAKIDESTARTAKYDLSPEDTQLLLKSNDTFNTKTQDILLTALAQALAVWTGNQIVRIDLEGHGREALSEDVDVSRTIGWLTSFFPMTLDLSAANDPGSAIKVIKEQRANLPHRGLSYGVLRYLGDANVRRQLASLPSAQLLFNYGGARPPTGTDKLLSLTGTANDFARAPNNRRSHVLEVNAEIVSGSLSVTWTYSTSVHRKETVDQLGQGFLESLRGLIQHCQSPDSGGFTPSDFPEAGLSQDELDDLLGELD